MLRYFLIIYFGLVGFCESNTTLGQVEINAGMGAQYQHESVLSNFPFKANVGVGYIVEKMFVGFDLELIHNADSAYYSRWRYGGSPSSSYHSTTLFRYHQRITHGFLGFNARLGGLAVNKNRFKCITGMSVAYYMPVYEEYDSIYIVESFSGNYGGVGHSYTDYHTEMDSLLNIRSSVSLGFFTSLRFRLKEQLSAELDLSFNLFGRYQTIRNDDYQLNSSHNLPEGSRAILSASAKLVYSFKPKDSNLPAIQTE